METIIAIDLENEEGYVIDQIQLSQPLELDPERLVIPNFSFCETYPQNLGNVIRLQFECQEKAYDQYDVEEALQELIDNIAMESEIDEPFDDLRIDQLRNAISKIFLVY